ncbi:calmodulin-lysine N-methyltransferase isoform X2 [Phalaenopsis equestris]|uniref:calmodulin-lysine N-methyltransferase isoform X2 n=1 Tax=Phalaenopsis equestris TaxID=78828 RepID=UPI0009E36E9C|nr:calmodulin-lysine N-methyltransferase isoform X2 [Phalaenopsis equestris]
MEKSRAATAPSRGSLRWAILRQAIRTTSPPSVNDLSFEKCLKDISKKTAGGFKLISSRPLMGELHSLEKNCLCAPNELSVCYALPVDGDIELIMIQRLDDCVDLDDFKISNEHDIDTTGRWPSEEVLTYFCIKRCEMFRSKRVLELGSGYGLAGLAIAASTDAFEVVISDGNPQVFDYVQRNININAKTFGDTKVKSMILHWNEELHSEMLHTFDIIIASDCTFFKAFHEGLAKTVISLLKTSETSEAIFLSPKRGDSLDKFLEKIKHVGLEYDLVEEYDSNVWNLHQKFQNKDDTSWPNYDEDHCYPILVRITLQKPKTT